MAQVRSNIWKLYALAGLTGVSFFLPVLVLFWQENGLSMTEIMVLQSIFSIAIVALEVPTGWFADRYGRRRALVLAGLFHAAGALIYSLGHGFSAFLAAELSLALGISLMSGADAAMLYDTLKDLGEEKRYARFWGHAFFVAGMAMMATQLLGGVIGKADYRLTLIVTVPFVALAIPVALSLEEPRAHRRRPGMRELGSAASAVLRQPGLLWLFAFGAALYAFNWAGLWLYQPYFSLIGIDVVWFGVLFASFQLVAALSGKYSYFIEERIGRVRSLTLLMALVVVSYLLMGGVVATLSFAFIYLQQFVRGFYKVVISDSINRCASSSVRATVLSIESMAGKLAYALLLPVIGLIVDAYSLTAAFTVLGVTAAAAGGVLLLLMPRSH